MLICNSLRGMIARKIQACSVIVLTMLATFCYTAVTSQNRIMEQSILAHDASQNVEYFNFTPRLEFTKAQWEHIFETYKVSDEDRTLFRDGKLNAKGIVNKYGVDVYRYSSETISDIATRFHVILERSFNTMVTNMENAHQYQIFLHEGTLNIPCMVSGSFPVLATDLTVSPEYARYNNLKVGDSLGINGNTYTISGLAWHPANNYPVVVPGTVKEASIYYPATQSVMFMTAEGIQSVQGFSNFTYKCKSEIPLDKGERNILYHRLYDTNAFKTSENGLDSITHGEIYVRVEGMARLASQIMLALLATCAFVVVQVIRRNMEADKRQLGILKALGYGPCEVALSYTVFGLACGLMGSALGYGLGMLAYKPLIIDALYADFNLPLLHLPVDYNTMLAVLVLPGLFFGATGFVAAFLFLRKSPIDLMGNSRESEVNALGAYLSEKLRHTGLQTRMRWLIASRSVSRLAAILIVVLLAGFMLILSLMLRPAFTEMITKTFQGVDIERIVVFYYNKNTNISPPRYQDEEISLGKDLFILEVRYQNGNSIVLDDTNMIMTETVGVSRDSTAFRLLDAHGDSLNNLLFKGLVVNKVIEGRYQIQVGDTVVLKSRHENKQAEMPVVGIADQYSGYLMFTGIDRLRHFFEYPDGTYNAVATNHTYEIADQDVDKILDVDAFKAGMRDNLNVFRIISMIVSGVAVLMAFFVIAVASNLVIEENSRTISILKILGYTAKEISGMVVQIYTPLLLLAYALAIPLAGFFLGVVQEELETKFQTPMPIVLDWLWIAVGLAGVLAVYGAWLRLSRNSIEQISLAEALKMET